MPELKKSLGAIQFFSIGFGGIVGIGWIVYMGIWFNQAGPVGTMVAFLIGGLLMALIALCYAEASAMFPVAGGEVAYAYSVFGEKLGFAVGWALVLMMSSVVPYVSIGLAWVLDALVPGIGGPVLYSWRGQPVYALGLAITLGWTAWLGLVNARGIHAAAKFQDWLTYGKIAISVLFFAAGIGTGSVANLEPFFRRGPSGAVLGGLIGVLATTPWFFGGFNEIPQALEERAPHSSPRTLGLIIVVSVLAAAGYYAMAALVTGLVGPWQQIVSADLPAAAAFRQAFGSELLGRVVLTAGLFGIITVGNGAAIAASRLLFALGRARMISGRFTRLHPTSGAPIVAILFVTVFGLLGDFLGRSGIAPIVNVGSAAACLAYLVTALAIWRLRRVDPSRARPYRIPFGPLVSLLAAAGSIFLLGSSLRQHWLDAKGGVPLEWVVILAWTAIGVWQWRAAAAERAAIDPQTRRHLALGEPS